MRELKSRKTELGFSLLEMLIAIVLFLIVTAAIWGLMRVGSIDRNRTSRRSDALKNGRASLQLMGRDALDAGLFYDTLGGYGKDNFFSTGLSFPVDPDTARDLLTPVFVGNNVTTVASVKSGTDMIAFARGDQAFNGGNPINITGATSNGAGGVTLTTLNGATSAANLYDLYLIKGTKSSTRTVAMLTAPPGTNSLSFQIGDPFAINQPGNGTAPSPLRPCIFTPTPTIISDCTEYIAPAGALLKRIFLITYSVKSDGTLVRTSYGNNYFAGATAADQKVEQPLAYGVKDLQIRYVLRDGTTSDDPTRDPTNPATYIQENLSLARQVIITLTVENGIDEATRQPTTVKLVGSFSLRNMEYN